MRTAFAQHGRVVVIVSPFGRRVGGVGGIGSIGSGRGWWEGGGPRRVPRGIRGGRKQLGPRRGRGGEGGFG